MSASLLSQLAPDLSVINQYLAEGDIESAQSKLLLIDRTLKALFASPENLSENDVLFLSDFSIKLNTTVLEISLKKQQAAKELGVHINTQKK
ncbi:hypothetical protein [Pseudoalteromonas sp. B160]